MPWFQDTWSSDLELIVEIRASAGEVSALGPTPSDGEVQ